MRGFRKQAKKDTFWESVWCGVFLYFFLKVAKKRGKMREVEKGRFKDNAFSGLRGIGGIAGRDSWRDSWRDSLGACGA